MESPRFGVYKQFNDAELARFAKMRHRIHALPPELFPSDTLPDRLARSLAKHKVVHVKELLESFEFFFRVRRRLRRPTMVDLCAGHGLAGLIFALCEPKVEKVELIDVRQPESFPRILDAFVEIAPWVKEKVTYRVSPLDSDLKLPDQAGVLLVHACGDLTDIGLKIASGGKHPVAAMPCCYGKAYAPKIKDLNAELGYERNIDVSRSYSLATAGYQVDWNAIPEAITPMNRLIVAWNHR